MSVAQKNAFVDQDGMLLAWGYVESNSPGDIKVPVPEDFDLMSGEWRYKDGAWVPVLSND